MIYTGRYSDKRLNNDNYFIVGISRGKPKFKIDYTIDTQLYLLAPTRDMWGKIGEEFTELYVDYLNKNIEKICYIVGKLKREANSQGKDLVLLCFEDLNKGKTCHRTRFKNWYEEVTKEEVIELDDIAVKKEAEEEVFNKNQMSFI